MSVDLEQENKQLKNRIRELEEEVEKWKETLEKYKESCRFQVCLLRSIVQRNSKRIQLINRCNNSKSTMTL